MPELMKQVRLADVQIEWKDLGDTLEITAPLLAVGEWTGLDGEPTQYTEEFLKKIYESGLGKPIMVVHEGQAADVGGFITHIALGEWKGVPAILFKGIIHRPEAKTYIRHQLQTDEHFGPSAELAVKEYKDMGRAIAMDGVITGVALVSHPACKICTPISAVTKQLGETKKMANASGEPVMTPELPKTTENPHFAKCLVHPHYLARHPVPPPGGGAAVEPPANKYPYPYPMPKGAKAQKVAKPLKELAVECEKVTGESCPYKLSDESIELEEFNMDSHISELVDKSVKNAISESLTGIKTELGGLVEASKAEGEKRLSEIATEIKTFDAGFDACKYLENIGLKDAAVVVRGKALSAMRDTIVKFAPTKTSPAFEISDKRNEDATKMLESVIPPEWESYLLPKKEEKK